MAKKKKRRRGGDHLLTQARQEANVRYGPEERGLKELLREARQELKTGISAEQGAARGIRAAADAARPEIRKVYARAGQDFDTADSDVTQNLLKIAGAGEYKAVAARESAGARRRLSEQLAGAEKELSTRKVQAEQGRAFGVGNQLRQYTDTSGKIKRQRQGLRGEKAQFTLATLHDLGAAEAKMDLEKAKIRKDYNIANLKEAGADERLKISEGGKDRRAAAEKDDKKHKSRFTPVQLRDARAQWKTGFRYARILKQKGKLTSGNADEVALAIKKRDVPLPLAEGAIQTALHGGVSKGTRRYIQHNYGLKPKVRPKTPPFNRLLPKSLR